MFTVDHQANRIKAVKTKTFSELGFTERKHLQEWLAYEPSALGEELLVIQKEFDGFDDTRERLDLLALDKDGNLVIIENKLYDSGRDVVWQPLKYTSYCASLTKLQIVDIFQQYINRYKKPSSGETVADASTQICEFLDAPDLDEVKINLGNSQRIMMVAANFRKEVTSTALWLLGQGINIQCFKVTPHALGEQLLINIDQIIPTPEAKELMIGISAKEAEEKTTEVVRKERHTVRYDYWEVLLEAFRNSNCDLYDNISPSKDHWIYAGSGVSNCPYSLIFGKKEIRVELIFGRSSTEENTYIFEELLKIKENIEATFGKSLEWLALENRKSCRIQYSQSVDGFNRENWRECVSWHLNAMTNLEKATKAPLQKVAEKLKHKK